MLALLIEALGAAALWWLGGRVGSSGVKVGLRVVAVILGAWVAWSVVSAVLGLLFSWVGILLLVAAVAGGVYLKRSGKLKKAQRALPASKEDLATQLLITRNERRRNKQGR